MSALEETRRLLMEPGSNLAAEDRSWIHLLPTAGRYAIIGDAPGEIQMLLTERFGADAVADGRSGDPADVVVVAASDQSVIQRESGLLGGADVVVHLPGAGRVGLDRSWLVVVPRRPGPRWLRRARTAARLVRTRLSVLVRGAPPSSARRHASDVGFVDVPAGLRSEPPEDAVGIAQRTFPVPEALHRIARSHDLRLDDGEWAFGPPRGFPSQKIIFRVRTQEGQRIFVKLTQAPRFNRRLEAEGRALDRVGALGLEHLALPVVRFRDQIDDLYVLGQTELDGTPLRLVADPDLSAGHASLAASALTQLGARTAQPATRASVQQALVDLVHDFERIYHPPEGVRARAREAVDRVARTDLPTVSMHGDFGVWNTLAVGSDRIGVLDWENADPNGMPLWDLFVFARTFGVLIADLDGRRYGPDLFRTQFSARSRFREVLSSRVTEYCDAVGVETSAVQGLFELCWIQQAVREAASLQSPRWLGSRGTRIVQAALEVGELCE